MRKVALIAVPVLLLGLICMFAFSGCGKQEEIPSNFPQRLQDRVVLKEVKAKEKIRHVHYLADGVTKKDADVEYVDGQSAHIDYRPDGTMSEARIYYPLEEGESKSRLSRHLVFDKDGFTYVNDVVTSKDGKKERVGQRTADEVYEVKFHAADGVKVKRHQTFKKLEQAPPPFFFGFRRPLPTPGPANRAKKWELVLDEYFRDNGKLEKDIKRMDDGGHLTRNFSEKDVLVSEVIVSRWNVVTSTYFLDDGKTPKLKTVQTSYQVTVTTYRLDGTVDFDYVFTYNNSMNVGVYDDHGKAKFRQEWVVDKEEKDDAGKVAKRTYRLTSVTEVDDKGAMKRKIDFHEDGKTPKTVIVPTPPNTSTWGPRTVKTYRPDGTLEKEEKYGNKWEPESTQTHTEKENIRETVDPELLKPHVYENPPPRLNSTNPFVRSTPGFNPYGPGPGGQSPYMPYVPYQVLPGIPPIPGIPPLPLPF